MGQTLTHGVYLPDEGERNCYSGLAANWQILDGAVGTIAAHTAALSGKAPLVHTHVKADIIDFPAYGTTAGTICEGNDSRLSDARTPVAHTHLTADVTDLLNSAHTWSGDNIFSKTLNIYNSDSAGAVPALYLKSSKSVRGTTTAGETDTQKIAVLDKNGNTVSENTTYVYSTGTGASWTVNAVYTTDSSNNVISSQISHYIYKDGRRVLRSESNTDLGTSANQWNNLYAKNYFYNGTAWGLDKSNTWTATNNFSTLSVFSNSVTYNEAPSSNVELPSIRIFGGGKYCGAFDYVWRSTGENVIRLSLSSYKSDGTFGYWSCNFGVPRDFSDGGKFGTPAFYPNSNNAYALGTSTNKWKTINGINPGALSLPKGYTEEGADKHYINIASVIQTLDGTLYSYTMPDNGWISVRAEQATQVHVTTDNWKFGQSIYSSAATTLIISIPFRKGDIVALKVRAVTLEHARFYPMQGNV